MASLQSIAEFLLSKINIYVSGACGPQREAPLECYTPIHRPYNRPAATTGHRLAADMDNVHGGGSLRILRNPSEVEQFSFVYDVDVVSTWRLPRALAAYEVYF